MAASTADKNAAAACRNIKVSDVCPPAMKKRDVWRIEQFNLLKKVGSGYASTVYMATCRTTGNQAAIKMYHKSKLSELNFFQVSREIQIHSRLNHKNIIQLWAAFEDQFGIYLVTEFAGKGDVFSDLERRGGQMSEVEVVREVLHPFLLSLVYLHGIKIMHRDIKPENLLFTSTGVLKVADFGLSIDFTNESPVTRVGTLDYMAPEVVVCPDKHKPTDHKDRKDLRYTPVADAWAVGVLAYELVIGRPPFDKGNKKLTIAEIVGGEPAIPDTLSPGAASFIRYSLTKDKHSRPTCQQLMDHAWIKELIQKQPAKRLAEGLEVHRRMDSFVDPRMLGMMGRGADAFDDEDEDEEGDQDYDAPTQPAKVVKGKAAKVLQAGHMGHLLEPRSMSVTDTSAMRWRDIAFNAEPGHGGNFVGTGGGAATAAAAARPQRRSDGEDFSQPSSRRVSYARPPGISTPPTGSLSSSGAIVMPLPGGGTQLVYQSSDSYDSYNSRPLTREELLMGMQSPSRAGSFSRVSQGSPLSGGGVAIPNAGSFSVSPGAGRRSGGGTIAASPRSFTSRLCTSSSGPQALPVAPGSPGGPPGSRTASSLSGVQRSPLSTSGSGTQQQQQQRQVNGSSASSLGRQSLVQRSLMVSGSPAGKPGSLELDATTQEMGRLSTGSEPSSPRAAASPSSPKRPQLPASRSGHPMVPSRMSSTSLTAPNSPVQPGAAPSRVLRINGSIDVTPHSSPSSGPISPTGRGPAASTSPTGLSPMSPNGKTLRPSLSHSPTGEDSRLKGVGGGLDMHDGNGDSPSIVKSAKGMFGGLKRIVFKPSA